MNSTPSFDKILNTKRRLGELLSRLEDGVQGTEYDSPLFRGGVQEARQRMDSERFMLAFVGDWNSGKSSLINRLLFDAKDATDASVLPVKDESTTSRATILRHGESAKLFVEPKGSRSAEDLKLLAEGEEAVRTALRTHGAAQGEKGSDREEAYNLVLEWPSEILRDGLVVVDTPGLSDPEDSRSEVTMEFVRKVDGVVVVAEAGTPFTAQLWGFLKDNVFDKRMKRFFFLMNKVDAVTPGEKEEKSIEDRLDTLRDAVDKKVSKLVKEFKEKFQEQASDAYEEVRQNAFFAVSAKTGENLDAFLETLEVFAREGKLRDCYRTVVHDVFETLYRLETRIKAEENASKKDVVDASEAIMALESRIPIVRAQQDQELEILEQKIRDVTMRVRRDLEGLFEGVCQETVSFLKSHKAWISFENTWERLWPSKLAEEARAHVKDQSYKLRKELSNTESSIQRDLEGAFHRYARMMARGCDDLGGMAQTSAPPEGWWQGEDGVWRFGNVGSAHSGADTKYAFAAASIAGGAGGAAWGVSQGVFTTTTIVSALPGWVPGASWLAAHGWFATTVSSTAWVGVASAVLWPVGILGAAAQGYFSYRSRNETFAGLDELAGDLRQKALTVPRDVEEGVWNRFNGIRDSLRKGFDERIKEMRGDLQSQKKAAERKGLSQNALNLRGLLAELRNDLAAISGELEG